MRRTEFFRGSDFLHQKIFTDEFGKTSASPRIDHNGILLFRSRETERQIIFENTVTFFFPVKESEDMPVPRHRDIAHFPRRNAGGAGNQKIAVNAEVIGFAVASLRARRSLLKIEKTRIPHSRDSR